MDFYNKLDRWDRFLLITTITVMVTHLVLEVADERKYIQLILSVVCSDL